MNDNKLHLLVPALMIAVFFHQFFLTHVHNLTQWKGGGFGMFSTLDKPEDRMIEIFLKKKNQKIPVVYLFDENENKIRTKAKNLPTSRNLNKLKQLIVKQTWYCKSSNNDICLFALSNNAQLAETDSPINYESVLIRIDRLHFDISKNILKRKTIIEQQFQG